MFSKTFHVWDVYTIAEKRNYFGWLEPDKLCSGHTGYIYFQSQPRETEANSRVFQMRLWDAVVILKIYILLFFGEE